MRKAFLLCLVIGVFTGLTKPVFAQSGAIEAHYKAINDHDVKAIAAGYTADAAVSSPNWEGAKAGPDSIAVVFKRYFSSTPDLAYTVTNVIDAGNTVVAEYTFSGTLSNPEGNTPDYMKGKKYTLKGCAVFVLKDGKIAKETDYFDQVAFLRQVGFFDQNR